MLMMLGAHLIVCRPHELKVAMRALGFDVKKQEVLRIIEDADRSGNATSIEFSDFMEVSM